MKSSRVEKLRNKFKECSADCGIVTSPADIFYLTGVKTSGVVIITEKDVIGHIPSVDFEECRMKLEHEVECKIVHNEVDWEKIGSLLKGKRVAFESGRMLHETYKKIRKNIENLVPVENLVSDLRTIKEPDEISLIRRSCTRAAEIIDTLDIEKWVGKSERDLAADLEMQSWKRGGTGTAFTPVVAAGLNSAYPHHIPADVPIEKGWLKIDYGIIYEGYCSDLTRTYILDKFLNKLDSHRLLENLEAAKERARKELKPGSECGSIYNAAKESLKECNLAEYFIHSLGHGVGIEIHEKPYLKPGESQVLQEGMVVTLEPGFYMPGIGGMRLEDTYLVTKEGSEKLTRISQ